MGPSGDQDMGESAFVAGVDIGRVVVNSQKNNRKHTVCKFVGQHMQHIILDLRSSNLLVDVSCMRHLGLRIRNQQMPDIELANGQLEKVLGVTSECVAEIEGVGVEIAAHCVEARGSYDILLGQDWLRAMGSSTDFSDQTYLLGGKICVK